MKLVKENLNIGGDFMIKKIVSVMICLFMFFSVFGCSQGIGNSATDLEISLLRCGLGREFLDNIAKAYKVKNPQVNISVDSSAVAGIFENTINAGAKNNTIDLYFTTEPKYFKLLADGNKNIADLTDIYKTTVEGENKTIEEKMPEIVRETFSYNGKYYALPWQAVTSGIVYNATFFEEMGYKVPRTTNELETLVEKIFETGNTPFIHNMNGYWNTVIEAWWAQYESIDGYNDFFRAKSGSEQPSVKIYEQQGRLETLKQLERIIAPRGYVYEGSNSLANTFSQTLFLNGAAYMMPNGGWMESEMKNDEALGKYDFKIMKTPILSSLVSKLGLSETKLREAIDYIDGEIATTDVDAKIIERLREARNVVHSVGFHCQVFIPEYSAAKDTAKDFLKFMYSDEGIQIYLDTLHFMPPVNFSDKTLDEIDTTGYSAFEVSQMERQKDAQYIVALYDYPLFYAGGATVWRLVPELMISAANDGDRMSGEEFYKDTLKSAQENWNQYLTLSGLK